MEQTAISDEPGHQEAEHAKEGADGPGWESPQTRKIRHQFKVLWARSEWALFCDYINRLIQVPELDHIYIVTDNRHQVEDTLAESGAKSAWADSTGFSPGITVLSDSDMCSKTPLPEAGRRGDNRETPSQALDTPSKPGDFHMGQVLQQLIAQTGLTHLLVSGGTALPLIGPDQLRAYIKQLFTMERGMITNNPQSGDLVLFHPANAIQEIVLPRSDNELSNNLQYQARLPRVLMEPSTATLFDIDTPIDLLLYYRLTGKPSWLMRDYAQLFERAEEKLEALIPVISRDYRELILAGRIAGNIIAYINEWLRVRLRVFAEERGMKALGRIHRGEINAFLGLIMEDQSVDKLFRYFEAVGTAILWDNRPAIYHMKKGLPGDQERDLDRFLMDLFYPEAVKDPVLQSIADRAYRSGLPLLMGGHSLVSGGIYALVTLVYRQGGPEV